ncbi:hypothetical protein B0E48_06295 [Rhodanobacter sp. C03]|nr:hypothetical protein B0E48_06295 [Rhodanobacter sp. C03]
MQRVTIPLSKSKLLFLLLVSCAFVVGGYWMFTMDAAEIESQSRFNSPLFVHGFGLAAIVFVGLAAVAVFRKLIDPSPGLVLDDRGLLDNSGAFSSGFIPWSDITGFEVRQISSRQRILFVLLKDPKKYIAKFKPIKRALLRANQSVAASPVAITSSSIAIGFDELVTLVNRYLSAYRQDA